MSELSSQKQDEIDLIELFRELWNKKNWIALCVLVCTLIAGIYAFTAKEQWTSNAEVIGPRTLDLKDYFTLRREYARILGQPFDSGALQNHLFGDFKLFVESLDVRKAFFEQSDYYKKLVEGKSEQEQRRILAELINNDIVITKPDAKKEPDLIGIRVSFSAETPTDAQDVLEQFINLTSQSVLKLEQDSFLLNFNEVLADLRFEKSKFERDLAIQKNVQLENLENALNIAKEAGLQDYAKSFSAANNSSAIQAIAMSEAKIPLSDSKLSDGTYLFMLGEKYLKAQIDVLKQNTVIYPPRYYEVSTLLSQLEPLLVKVNDAKAKAFSYQASPDYPIIRDKPKTIFILLVSSLIGLMLSSIYFLIRAIFKGNI